jgi:hypothetical protein
MIDGSAILYPPGHPQLGCLPDTGAPRLAFRGATALGIALPPLPDSADFMAGVPWPTDGDGMLGNRTWGCCVIDAIVMAFLAQWHYFRPNDPPPPITAQNCIDAYCEISGVYTAPGPGLDIQTALDWFRRKGILDSAGQRHRILCFSQGTPTIAALYEAVAEMIGIVLGATIYYSDRYGVTTWTTPNQLPELGGHAFLGGAFNRTPGDLLGIRTWATKVEVTDGFIASDFDRGFWLPIFEDLWPHYSYERQVQCVTDLPLITGRAWPGPAPTPPPAPPLPEATVQLLSTTQRLFDGPVAAKTVVTIPVAGVGGIPATATGAALILRVVRAATGGWIYAGPDPSPRVFGPEPAAGGVPSTLDYNAGQVSDLSPIVALTNGKLTIWSTQALTRLVVDVTGFLTVA